MKSSTLALVAALAVSSVSASSTPLNPSSLSTFHADSPSVFHFEVDQSRNDDDDDDDADDGARGFLSPSRPASRTVGSIKPAPFLKTNLNSRAVTSKAVSSRPVAVENALNLRGGAVLSEKQVRMMWCAAVVTLAFEFICGHGLEFVKIYKMTNVDKSYGQIVRKITSEKGIVGIWDGFVPWGVLQSLGKGGAFGVAHAIVLPVMLGLYNEGKLPYKQLAEVIAGGLAGGFQGYVLSPLLLLKTRVMTDPVFREKMGTGETIVKSLAVGGKVLKNDGPIGLMKGSNTFAFKRIFDWATRFYFAELFEQAIQAYTGVKLTDGQKMLASLLGGSLSAVSTLPLDSLLSKIQDAKNSGNSDGAIGMLRKEYQTGGVKGLWKNYMVAWEMRCIHVGLTTVALKTWSPMVYDIMYKK
jgi:hypothetical protein